MYLIFLIKPQR